MNLTLKWRWCDVKKSLRILEFFILRGFKFALRNRGVTLAVSLMIFAVAISALPRSRTILSMDDLVDDTFESRKTLDKLYADFKTRQSLLLAVESPVSGFPKSFLCDLKSWLTDERLSNTEILSSLSVFDLRSTLYDGERLRFPLMVDPDCEKKDETRITLENVADSPWGPSVTDRDSRLLLLQIDLREADAGSRLGSFNPKSISDIREHYDARVGTLHPDLKSYWIGAADFQHHMYKGLGRVSQLNLIMLFVLIVLLRAFFGTWRAGFIFVFSILACGLMLFGGMAWAGIPVDILSKSLFLIIAVSALEDFVFIGQQQLKAAGSAGGAGGWRTSFRTMLVPGFLTSMTSVLGFGSLCISDLVIIRRFGFWASVGALLEWVILFFVLPSLLARSRRWKTWVSPEKIWIRTDFFVNKIRVPRKFALILLSVYAFAAYGMFHLRISDVPLDMFSKTHSFRVGTDLLKARLGWESVVNLVFEEGDKNIENSEMLTRVKALPNVAAVQSPYAMIDFLTHGQPPLTGQLITRSFKMTNLYEQLHASSGRSRALIFIKDSELVAIEKLKSEIQEICGTKCFLAGGVLPYSEFAQRVPKTLLESFTMSLVLVSLVVLWLAYAVGQRNILWLLICSCWGTMVMVVIVSATQMNVNFLTCVFASILVGLTGDNAIQYLCASKRGRLTSGLDRRAAASIACSGIMAAASLIFLGSYFVPPRLFGLMLSSGLILALIGDLWLLRGLLEEK